MKLVAVSFFLALGIQGAMSENDNGENGCIVPAVCKRSGYIETVWMPIARPVCEADFGMKVIKDEAGLKGENGAAGPVGEDRHQGKVGNSGPKGDIGDKGGNGSNDAVGAKGEKGIMGRFGPKGELASADVDSLVFKSIIKVVCPMKHENKCFFPVIGRIVDYDSGVAICQSLGAHLANIYSQIHMDDVMKYIRENRMDSEGYGYWKFRLGLIYDLKAKKLTLRDGTYAPAGMMWRSGGRYTGAGKTNVILGVNIEQSSDYQYLFNSGPSQKNYVICEIE